MELKKPNHILSSKAKRILGDVFHLLFKPASSYHLRTQKCKENASGEITCEITFDSYASLKKYQKRLRRITVSLSTAVGLGIVAIVGPLIFNTGNIQAASFQWLQADWSTESSDNASNDGNKTGWTKYFSKDATITASSNSVTLAEPSSATTGDTTTEYGAAGTGTGAGQVDTTKLYKTSSNALSLKKPNGASCSSPGNAECMSSQCAGGLCIAACDASTVCGQSCAYQGALYNTVLSNNKCWFDKNLMAQANRNGTPVTRYCYGDNPANCGNDSSGVVACGGLYDNSTHSDLMCPTGWHMPTESEWAAEGDIYHTNLNRTCCGRFGGSSYEHMGSYVFWWSATSGTGYSYSCSGSSLQSKFTNVSTSRYSIRCIKD